MDQQTFYQKILNRVTTAQVTVTGYVSIGGGCIHHAVRVVTKTHGNFFVKSNDRNDADMFEKEFLGLKKLREADCLPVPEPLGHGQEGNYAYIITEYVETGSRKNGFWEKFGMGLADLHRHQAGKFGLDHDNYIGRLPQRNDLTADWIDFFIRMRLEEQLKLAVDRNRIDQTYVRRFGKLMDSLYEIMPEEPPSLLHGDLWSGNFMTGLMGDAVLIDPAVYYGNREIELSFTRMFGGFDEIFYRSYDEAYPLEPGFEDRVEIYNLYPTLVHVNLFGSSYLDGIDRVLRRFA